jgi:hypothetical protein
MDVDIYSSAFVGFYNELKRTTTTSLGCTFTGSPTPTKGTCSATYTGFGFPSTPTTYPVPDEVYKIWMATMKAFELEDGETIPTPEPTQPPTPAPTTPEQTLGERTTAAVAETSPSSGTLHRESTNMLVLGIGTWTILTSLRRGLF